MHANFTDFAALFPAQTYELLVDERLIKLGNWVPGQIDDDDDYELLWFRGFQCTILSSCSLQDGGGKNQDRNTQKDSPPIDRAPIHIDTT